MSNAPRHYVIAVLKAMRILRYFDAIETIESMRFVPKPAASSMKKILARHGAAKRRTVMVEDNLDNLKTAHRLGLRTVWIAEPGIVTRRVASPAIAISAARARPRHVHLKVHSVLKLHKHCLPTLNR